MVRVYTSHGAPHRSHHGSGGGLLSPVADAEAVGAFSSRGASSDLGEATGSFTGSSSLSPEDAEAVGQVASRLREGQTVALGPEVKDIALGATGSIETLKDVLMKIY